VKYGSCPSSDLVDVNMISLEEKIKSVSIVEFWMRRSSFYLFSSSGD
jgi:hypothetical protein